MDVLEAIKGVVDSLSGISGRALRDASNTLKRSAEQARDYAAGITPEHGYRISVDNGRLQLVSLQEGELLEALAVLVELFSDEAEWEPKS